MDISDTLQAHGHGRWELFTNRQIVAHGTFHNIITAYGQRMYWERGASVVGYPSAPTGMRLGTGNETPTYTGDGATIDTYLSGSAIAFSAAPASTMPSNNRRVTYQCTWLPGVGTGLISEAVLTNENPLSDIPGTEATTIARVLFDTPLNKGSVNGLTLVWHHTLGD